PARAPPPSDAARRLPPWSRQSFAGTIIPLGPVGRQNWDGIISGRNGDADDTDGPVPVAGKVRPGHGATARPAGNLNDGAGRRPPPRTNPPGSPPRARPGPRRRFRPAGLAGRAETAVESARRRESALRNLAAIAGRPHGTPRRKQGGPGDAPGPAHAALKGP